MRQGGVTRLCGGSFDGFQCAVAKVGSRQTAFMEGRSHGDKSPVTGGAGYIGSVLVPLLLAEGHSVHVLDQFIFGQTSLAECCISPSFQVTRGDCRDKGTMSRLLREADFIIPLAAVVVRSGLQQRHDGGDLDQSRSDQAHPFARSKDQRIILPNTNSGYGIGEKAAYCTEKTPLNPISLYGKTKVEAELAVLEAGNSITFRLATVFGMSPRMRIDLLVNDFVYRALHDRAVVIFEGHAKTQLHSHPRRRSRVRARDQEFRLDEERAL